jgi:hypothetical protein
MKIIKNILSVLASAALMLALVSADAGAVEFEGDGTPESPLLIGTVEQLLAFGERVTGGETGLCAELTDDLTVDDWTAICPPAPGSNIWEGDSPYPYAGVFDGQGQKLTLSKNDGTKPFIALFHTVGPSGVVRNLNLDVTFTGDSYVAGVAGKNYGTIERVTVDGVITVTYASPAGGIAGFSAQKAVDGVMTGGKILHCLNRAEVNGTGNYLGGVVGSFMGEMRYCGNTGTVTSTGFLGGLLMMGPTSGQSLFKVSDCYNAGTVTTTDGSSLLNSSFAGLLGGTDHSVKNWPDYKISNVFSYGSVVGNNDTSNTEGRYNKIISGILDNDYTDGHVGMNYANTYYLDSLTGRLFGKGDFTGASLTGYLVIMGKSAAEFASAEMAVLLNNGRTGAGAPWEYIAGAPYPTIKPIGNKAALEAAIAETAIESLNEEDYNPSRWRALTSALAEAEALAGGEFVKQDEIDAALANLAAALDSLVPSDVGGVPAQKPGIVAEEDIPLNIIKTIRKIQEELEEVSAEKKVELGTPEPITRESLLADPATANRLNRLSILSDADVGMATAAVFSESGALAANTGGDGAAPAAVYDDESGVLVANTEALLEANTGEDAVEIGSALIPLPIVSDDVSEKQAILVTTLSVPLGAFADGFNAVGDAVLLKLKRDWNGDRSVTALRRVSSLSEIDNGLYAITDGYGEVIPGYKAIEKDGVYLFVVGIGDDSDLDWDTNDCVVVDPLYTALGSGGDSSSGGGGCSAGLSGAFAILAALAAAYGIKRRDR